MAFGDHIFYHPFCSEYYFLNGWNKNGEVFAENGNGKMTYYYENGQIMEVANFKNGKLNDRWTSYYEDGQIKEEGNFKGGECDGKWIYYNEDGSINKIEEN